MAKVIAIANQKGGVGKTTTTANLGFGLARHGYKVLLVDCDAQGNLSDVLGYKAPDTLDITLSTLLRKALHEEYFEYNEGILVHKEGVHLLPGNIELAQMEMELLGLVSRETVLKSYLDEIKDNYDYVLLDCSPSLGMITVNALSAANSVLIPVQAHYLPTKGMAQLSNTIRKVQKSINPRLQIEGILLTMTDNRTNLSKEITESIREKFGAARYVFKTEIPRTVKAIEHGAQGVSIYSYDKTNKAATAYEALTEEVISNSSSKTAH